MIEHEHTPDLVIRCGTCGRVLDLDDISAIAQGLASLTVTSDNLTSADDVEAELLLTADMGTD